MEHVMCWDFSDFSGASKSVWKKYKHRKLDIFNSKECHTNIDPHLDKAWHGVLWSVCGAVLTRVFSPVSFSVMEWTVLPERSKKSSSLSRPRSPWTPLPRPRRRGRQHTPAGHSLVMAHTHTLTLTQLAALHMNKLFHTDFLCWTHTLLQQSTSSYRWVGKP